MTQNLKETFRGIIRRRFGTSIGQAASEDEFEAAAREIAGALNALSLSAVRGVEEALRKCAVKFREYEQLHAERALSSDGQVYSPDRLEKAARNREMAEMCEAALSLTPAVDPEGLG